MATLELIYSRAFWRHIDECPTCSMADGGMCRRGAELLEAKNEEIAERMLPIPVQRNAGENDA